MHEYEIRIHPSLGSPTIIMLEIHLSDFTAIRRARRMARGGQFEVWKDEECITGLATLSPVAA